MSSVNFPEKEENEKPKVQFSETSQVRKIYHPKLERDLDPYADEEVWEEHKEEYEVPTKSYDGKSTNHKNKSNTSLNAQNSPTTQKTVKTPEQLKLEEEEFEKEEEYMYGKPSNSDNSTQEDTLEKKNSTQESESLD